MKPTRKLTVGDKLRRAIVRLLFPQAQYEAGQRGDARRSYVHGWVQDARYDADAMTRLEILRKARYFERNSAIVNRLADLFEEYTVGSGGLAFVPGSSDEEWNHEATAWWDKWCQFPDVRTLQTFSTIQSLVARSWAIDGEIFIQKTAGRVRAGERSYPRIQLVETHRVESPPSAGSNIIDGVQVDDRGRPEAYWVREGDYLSGERHVPVPADNMIHLFEPTRPGMYRGLSMLYPVLNDLHDLDDLQVLEMDAAKEAAATTSIIKTKTGEIDDDTFRRVRMGLDTESVNGTDGTSGGSSQDRTSYYDDVFRGRVKVLRHDDDYAQFQSTRPSVATKDYWDYLTAKVCCGFGVSKLLVLPYSMQGTVTRADLDTSATFFRSRSSVIAASLTEVWGYVMEWATRNENGLADPPADWRSVAVRPPRSVNVDVGRNSSALIDEYAAGWRTLEEICGELGYDYRRVLRQRAKERKLARELEHEFDLEPGELIKAALEAIKATKQQALPAPAAPKEEATA